MFVVDNIIISDDVVDAPFACNLGACHGACCVRGDSGAPLDPDERVELETVLPVVEHRLRREAREVIQEHGVWEEIAPGEYATTCVGTSECVFVVYDGSVAKCAIEQAYHAGRTAFRKPISCHLYPIRVESLGEFDGLNYEQLEMCRPAIRRGKRENVQLSDFLAEALSRKYGSKWVEKLKDIIRERRSVLTDTP
jgi:hypothetical protein